VDLDDLTIIIDRFGRKIKKLMSDARMRQKPKMYAFATTPSDNILNNCKKVGFVFFDKPSKLQMLDVLRHMATDDIANELQAKEKKVEHISEEEEEEEDSYESNEGDTEREGILDKKKK